MTTARSKLAELAAQLKARVNYYRAIYRDPRTPWLARALL